MLQGIIRVDLHATGNLESRILDLGSEIIQTAPLLSCLRPPGIFASVNREPESASLSGTETGMPACIEVIESLKTRRKRRLFGWILVILFIMIHDYGAESRRTLVSRLALEAASGFLALRLAQQTSESQPIDTSSRGG
ncbi:uncharacterized protein PADG_05167 [Paracoccidioides brasiliensis Pb18]|uniref:Uncharacterized protein n=1 Tax=Paracoccidioides brasiliensis (strain Pb18) TaxID=502780 RepID=C1GD31_PARBD|nr:uncharacterized protein PADG_05167 [Paracoccidioides brasiliensis Pb18]EEH49088.2 hypothetical protein PADG_05167 [Paracoccidioides brasiliensis Pb18]